MQTENISNAYRDYFPKPEARCEDYPCCGHTDGLGCNYTPDYDYIYKHLGCDHEAFPCYLTWEDD